MTYLELYDKATRQLEKSEITLGEYEEMIKPRNREIEQSEDCVSRQVVHEMLENLPITSEDKWFNWLQKACLRLVDLPPVTSIHGTCKECKEWINDKKYPRCRESGFALNEDFYCSDFERKE